MKHIAIRSRSVHANNHYIASGLGDRIHGCTTAWVYGQRHCVPVTLHISHKQIEGGQVIPKRESWREISRLFPDGAVSIRAHSEYPQSEASWLEYLKAMGIDAEICWYSDYPGPVESVERIDMAEYFATIPLLSPEPKSMNLPDRFITTQWDANSPRRRVADSKRAEIIDRYRRDGYSVVIVGGESKDDNLRQSLAHIGFAMSRAELHVGVDSGFFHMAQLYLPRNRIHLYNELNGYYSEYAKRAIDHGVVLNRYVIV